MNDASPRFARTLTLVFVYLGAALLAFLFYISVPRTTLKVSDQSKGAFLLVDEVTLAKPGFVVFSTETEKTQSFDLGQVLAVSLYLLPGVYKNMNVPVYQDRLSGADVVRVMVYEDDGDEFFNGEEAVVTNVFNSPVKKYITLY